MSSDIKKLISIFNETTTAGSVASVSSPVGESPLKRSKDTIFAAEEGEQTECAATDTQSSPSNFGLWKNSASIGKEQQGKHGRKSSTGALDKTIMYPQLAEATQPEQRTLDARTNAAKRSERGETGVDPAPRNEWYIMVNGSSEKGKKTYPSRPAAEKRSEDIKAFYKSKGWSRPRVEIIQQLGESYKAPKDMDDYTDDDWAEWDAKVGRVGDKAKEQDSKKAKEQEPKKSVKEGVAKGSDDNEPFNYDEWKASKVKPRKPRGYKDAEAIGQQQKKIDRERKEKKDQGVAEAGNKPIDKQFPLGTGDTRTPRDIKSQMSGASDRFVQQTAASKPGRFNSNVAKMQNKMANSELRKRSDHDRMATGTNEGQELSEEMIADRLKSELALFKKGTKAKDKALGSKPKSKEVQPKPAKKDNE